MVEAKVDGKTATSAELMFVVSPDEKMNEAVTLEFEELNSELVDVFNNVMWIEEAALKQSDFSDITLKDMHTIDAISMYSEKVPHKSRR